MTLLTDIIYQIKIHTISSLMDIAIPNIQNTHNIIKRLDLAIGLEIHEKVVLSSVMLYKLTKLESIKVL